jgi:hypothetical protein
MTFRRGVGARARHSPEPAPAREAVRRSHHRSRGRAVDRGRRPRTRRTRCARSPRAPATSPTSAVPRLRGLRLPDGGGRSRSVVVSAVVERPYRPETELHFDAASRSSDLAACLNQDRVSGDAKSQRSTIWNSRRLAPSSANSRRTSDGLLAAGRDDLEVRVGSRRERRSHAATSPTRVARRPRGLLPLSGTPSAVRSCLRGRSKRERCWPSFRLRFACRRQPNERKRRPCLPSR